MVYTCTCEVGTVRPAERRRTAITTTAATTKFRRRTHKRGDGIRTVTTSTLTREFNPPEGLVAYGPLQALPMWEGDTDRLDRYAIGAQVAATHVHGSGDVRYSVMVTTTTDVHSGESLVDIPADRLADSPQHRLMMREVHAMIDEVGAAATGR